MVIARINGVIVPPETDPQKLVAPSPLALEVRQLELDLKPSG